MIARLWKNTREAVKPKAPTSRDASALKAALGLRVARRDHDAALQLIAELEDLEPIDPRWPHKAGDVLRFMGRHQDAAVAYRRAAQCYDRLGFDGRSRAMRNLARQLTEKSTEAVFLHPSLR